MKMLKPVNAYLYYTYKHNSGGKGDEILNILHYNI